MECSTVARQSLNVFLGSYLPSRGDPLSEGHRCQHQVEHRRA